MPIQMPNSLKALLFLPFGLFAVKSVVIAFLMMGPTDSLLSQVKAPESGQAVTAMAQSPMAAPVTDATDQAVRGPF